MQLKATPVITAGAYSAGDAVGGLMTFAGATNHSGGSGLLASVVIIDNNAAVKANLELWLFSKSVTVAADNAAFAISAADMQYLVGAININTSDYLSAAAVSTATASSGLPITYQLAGSSLYGQLMCVATPTYVATGDLTVILGVDYLSD